MGRHCAVSCELCPTRAPFTCKLLECSDCSLRFFDVRLSPEEVERLYSGYRGADYFRERHHHEFWYPRALKDGIGSDPEEVAKRVSSLERSLKGKLRRKGLTPFSIMVEIGDNSSLRRLAGLDSSSNCQIEHL